MSIANGDSDTLFYKRAVGPNYNDSPWLGKAVNKICAFLGGPHDIKSDLRRFYTDILAFRMEESFVCTGLPLDIVKITASLLVKCWKGCRHTAEDEGIHFCPRTARFACAPHGDSENEADGRHVCTMCLRICAYCDKHIVVRSNSDIPNTRCCECSKPVCFDCMIECKACNSVFCKECVDDYCANCDTLSVYLADVDSTQITTNEFSLKLRQKYRRAIVEKIDKRAAKRRKIVK